jgi:hypothetical protein
MMAIAGRTLLAFVIIVAALVVLPLVYALVFSPSPEEALRRSKAAQERLHDKSMAQKSRRDKAGE